ncbi:MAG: hypothetical protein M5U28_02585 [Sandaracinaceae bacterium]|nr:hypothetical protein [Sandaracinaceae bacterium]
MADHPRDRYLTVYGRKPVLEVLELGELAIARVFVARGARGPMIAQIRDAAARRGVEVVEKSAAEVSRISRRPKQDQGVAADVEAPAMRGVEDFLASLGEGDARVLALDNVTTPANVGMILRTATVLGLDGVLVPRRGCPEIGPLVIKGLGRRGVPRAHRALRGARRRAERLQDAGLLRVRPGGRRQDGAVGARATPSIHLRARQRERGSDGADEAARRRVGAHRDGRAGRLGSTWPRRRRSCASRSRAGLLEFVLARDRERPGEIAGEVALGGQLESEVAPSPSRSPWARNE